MSSEKEGGGGTVAGGGGAGAPGAPTVGVKAPAGDQSKGNTTVGAKAAASDQSKGSTTAGAKAAASDQSKGANSAGSASVSVSAELEVQFGGGGGGGSGSIAASASVSVGGGKNGRAFDHQGGFNFSIEMEFDGIKAGSFRSVEGLAATVELIEYQGGGDKYARQIPGRPKIAPVVLKKGYVNTATLWSWMKATMEGQTQLQNVSIVLLDDDGQTELARYNLLETWPSSWKGWQLDANASNAMVEELELQVRQVERVSA